MAGQERVKIVDASETGSVSVDREELRDSEPYSIVKAAAYCGYNTLHGMRGNAGKTFLAIRKWLAVGRFGGTANALTLKSSGNDVVVRFVALLKNGARAI